MSVVGMSMDFIGRDEPGFVQKKRNEILQMASEPELAILDETDSASTSTRSRRSLRA